MKQIRSILLAYLGNNGFSNRTIAKATNVSRPVVAKYLGILAKHPLSLTQVNSLNDSQLQKHLEIDTNTIYETQENVELSSWLNENVYRLSKVGVTRRLLHEEYCEKYKNPLQYSQFCFVLKSQYAAPESSALFDHKAGDKLYVDFTGEKLHWLDASQVMHTEEVFLAVLGASAYVFATPTYSQKQEDFANAMQDTFLFFGGVPKAVVPDCLKSAVIHNDGYEPVHNQLFKKLLDHYGTLSIPARPHHPKDKPYAENSVNLIYRQILARIDGKTFVNRDAMLVWWKKALAKINSTPFQKLPGNRQDLFDKTDKLALKPLPEFLFDLSAIKAQTVGTTNTVYISEDKTYYSVPYALFGKKVDIHITPKQIHVWYENECRVTHERKFEAGKVILNEHLPEDKNWFAGRNISEQIRSLEVNGKHVVLWAKKIEEISGHEDIAWNLLNGLSKIIAKYPTRIDAVCRIALSKNLCSLKHLNDIINTLKLEGIRTVCIALHEAGDEQLNISLPLLNRLIDAESEYRREKKTISLSKKAQFRYQASVASIATGVDRNLDKATILRLSEGLWIRQGKNLLITGPTGAGKSFLASALGQQACKQGLKTLYFNCNKLWSHLSQLRSRGRYEKEIKLISKADLVVLDDFGLVKLESSDRLSLLEILEDRWGKASTIVVSQRTFNTWHEVLGEPTIADAICDRLFSNSEKIELKGESLRKRPQKIDGNLPPV